MPRRCVRASAFGREKRCMVASRAAVLLEVGAVALADDLDVVIDQPLFTFDEEVDEVAFEVAEFALRVVVLEPYGSDALQELLREPLRSFSHGGRVLGRPVRGRSCAHGGQILVPVAMGEHTASLVPKRLLGVDPDQTEAGP